MTNVIVPLKDSQIDLQRFFDIGQEANRQASQGAFTDYRALKTESTLKAHDNDIELFRLFFEQQTDQTLPDDMNVNPTVWGAMTYGLLKLFRNWLLINGYAVSTINRAISTMRKYSKLAYEEGFIETEAYERIRLVSGYGKNDAIVLDQKRRDAEGMRTRREFERNGVKTCKKALPVTLTPQQIKQLKNMSWVAPDNMTQQFYRDQLMMCLFLDHGLRCSELADLKVKDINLDKGSMTFYRRKIKESHTHKFEDDTRYILKLWFKKGYAPTDPDAPLLRGSRKGGKLTDKPMSTRSITKRVNTLGKKIGLSNLSAHDCRHSMADQRAADGANVAELLDVGGWKTLSVAKGYLDRDRVMNANAPRSKSVLIQRELI